MNNDRQSWLAARRKLIGASDSPSILGHGYNTPAEVWAEKCGAAQPESTAIKLQIGTILQPAIAEVARLVTGKPIIEEPPNTIRMAPGVEYIGASLDAYVEESGAHCPFELKNVDKALAWQWKDAAPLGFQIQVMHQCYVTGAPHGYAFGLIGGNDPVCHRVERNDEFIRKLLNHLEWFWGLVQTKTPPPYEDPEDQRRVLAALYPRDNGTAIELPDRASFYYDRAKRAADFEKRAAEIKEAHRNELREMLGEHGYGMLPDGRWVSNTLVEKGEYVVKASSYRMMRFSDKKPKAAPFLIASYEETARVEADRLLLAAGAELQDESEAGSRYYEMPGGLIVRVANHEPNEATARWMERAEVAGVRVDLPDWRNQLQAVVGSKALPVPEIVKELPSCRPQ